MNNTFWKRKLLRNGCDEQSRQTNFLYNLNANVLNLKIIEITNNERYNVYNISYIRSNFNSIFYA